MVKHRDLHLTQESRIISAATPLKALPYFLRRSKTSPMFPPLFHYGWIIDKAKFCTLAQEHHTDVWGLLGDGYELDWFDEFELKKDPVTKETLCLDIAESFDRLVGLLLRERSIKIPFHHSYIKGVYHGNPCRLGLALSLCDNYHTTPSRRPKATAVKKVHEVFGFDSEPGWYADATYSYWRDKDY